MRIAPVFLGVLTLVTSRALSGEPVRLPAAADAYVTLGPAADSRDTVGTLRITAYQFDPSMPAIAVQPPAPKAGDALTIKITQASVTADGKPVTYAYAWFKQSGTSLKDQQFVQVQSSPEPALAAPVKAGERYRVFVIAKASAEKQAMSEAHVTVADEKGQGAQVTYSGAGQFLYRRAYAGFDLAPLAGKTVTAARLALYVRPDVSWSRQTVNSAILVHLVPRAGARFNETALTWQNQPMPEITGEPLGRIDLPGRNVTENDARWQAWSKLHNITWENRQRTEVANDFSNDPQYGFWHWGDADVTAAVQAELAAPAAASRAASRWITFCLTEPLRTTFARSDCAVRSRDYEGGRYAPALVVTVK